MKTRMRTRCYLKESDPYFYSKTANQWREEKRVVNKDSIGETMWTNGYKQYKADYFTFEETHPATPEELEEWKEAKRDGTKKDKLKRKEKVRVKKAREEKLKAEQEAEQEAKLWLSRVMDASKIICFSMKANGIDPYSHEILQLSIIDGSGQILFNEYIKPFKNVTWDERKTHAITTHEITPEMVNDKPYIDKYIPKLRAIFSVAEVIVWYNSGGYPDLLFFEKAGIEIPVKTKKFDMQDEFAEIYGEWDDFDGDWELQSLDTCAEFYNYKGNENIHTTLEEAHTILYCYNAMIEKEK